MPAIPPDCDDLIGEVMDDSALPAVPESPNPGFLGLPDQDYRVHLLALEPQPSMDGEAVLEGYSDTQ